MIILYFTIAEYLSLLAASPFYNVIIEFLGYYKFPPFAPLGTRTNVVLATLVAGPFLISHNFLLLVFLPQKSLADFLF